MVGEIQQGGSCPSRQQMRGDSDSPSSTPQTHMDGSHRERSASRYVLLPRLNKRHTEVRLRLMMTLVLPSFQPLSQLSVLADSTIANSTKRRAAPIINNDTNLEDEQGNNLKVISAFGSKRQHPPPPVWYSSFTQGVNAYDEKQCFCRTDTP